MKKVSFSCMLQTVIIIDLEYDAVLYAEARNGRQWLNFAVDRCRFKKRIDDCNDALQNVLNAEHRCKMYKIIKSFNVSELQN